ncbi:MAG: hypothetical protein QNJ68_15820 [Microcoleaceae cyanobacterium MO_207.B10]|nr:hypothetical protein [Microcoleaceae cyanobacterium MO_207.B10]
MNKQLIAFVSAISLVIPANIALARTHGAHCLNNNNGELNQCKVNVDISGKRLDITFDKEEYQDANFTLRRDQITELSTGDYAKTQVRKSVASGILSPVSGIINAIDKQARIQIAIVYLDEQNNENVTLVDIPSRYALLLRQELETMTGLKIKS